MDDETHVIDNGWDVLPEYADKSGDGDDAVTVSISTTPGEWLVNTVDSVVVPMSMAELVDGLRAGTLTERSLVWRQGMQEWACVAAVPQLKLAARMTSTPAAAARARPPEKPSSPPARQTPRPTSSPHAGLSRRSTLPFGLPTPPGSRPSHLKPSSPQPALSPDEPEVLAVYARPAATISFDLSPEQPLRAPGPRSVAPQTLAPTTTDSSSRSVHPPHRVADLSVVAAADYRAVQRSGKRSVLLWSLGSAVAASLLTFWISRSGAPQASPATQAGQAVVVPEATPSTAPALVQPAAPDASVAVGAEPAASAAPSAKAAVVVPSAPKAHRPIARKRKVVAPAQVAPNEPSAGEPPSTKSPSSDNPYDVKLDEEEPKTKSAAAQRSGLEDPPTSGEVSATSTPGF